MEKKGISIIIPCYNVERYIVNCLNSIKKQLKNINHEIILVDDKSKDKTKQVIKKYLENTDANIIFIENDKNIGAGASRNKALKQAKYDYISFVDSDDFLDDNFYEEMLFTIEKSDADVVICDINFVYEDGTPDLLNKVCDGKVNKYKLINNGLAASPCNKIIKKELLLEFPFAEGIMNEDVASIIAIIANCNKAVVTHNTKYNYIQRGSSIQNSSLSEKRLDIFKSIEILEERIKDNLEYEYFMPAVVFQQIILFFAYIPIKEPNYFKRAKFLRKFYKYSKKYNLRQNPLYWNFLELNNKKSKIYYKILFKLNCNGFSYTCSLIMSLYRIYKKIRLNTTVIESDITMETLVKAAIKNQKSKVKKTITVAIPNYNYSEFLFQRLYSILYQKYKIDEIIILDDCSQDNSRLIIDNIEENLSPYIKIKKIYNEKNSGSVFKQWKKALSESQSEYLWIAEADDYCDKHFLSSIMKMVEKDEEISIAYTDTAFINKEGVKILKSIKPEIDIMKTGHWDKHFINDGKEEINNYAFLNCTIANVSSVIFKKFDYTECFDELTTYKQVGDYLFYINAMDKGKIAFYNKPLNYYRLHGNNVTSTTKKQLHLNELKRVHQYIDNKYHLNSKQKKEIQKRYKFLERVWELDEN